MRNLAERDALVQYSVSTMSSMRSAITVLRVAEHHGVRAHVEPGETHKGHGEFPIFTRCARVTIALPFFSVDPAARARANECHSMGKKREELGIVAAVRAEIYFRGNVYPVSWDKLEQLAELGSDVILIEKEGVSIALEPFARRRGVALINSRGFIVEYAKDLMDLSRVHHANIFQLTDMDASGLLISSKVEAIPRIGIDHETIARLGLKLGDVSEIYNPHKKHMKALPKDLQDSVRSYRIEIDSVLAEVGPERFWEHLEDRMVELAPKRDLNRSLDLSINLPDEISGPIDMLTRYIKAMGKPEQHRIMMELREWKDGFLDVTENEQRLQDEIVESFSDDRRIMELSEALNELVSTLCEKKL